MPAHSKMSPETIAVQTLHHDDDNTGSVIPPIYPSTTYARDADYNLISAYNYSRYSSPTVSQAEATLASLDNGAEALLFSSGLAAVAALLETLNSSDRIVAPQIMYHGALDWFRRIAQKRGIVLDLFDQQNPDSLRQTIDGREAAVIWLENPCNPTWDVIDISTAAVLAHGVGAILVVDSTVAPPCTTRSLELGADIVFHSVTKYLNGHSDVTGGVLVTAKPDERWAEIYDIRKLMGSIMAPFEAWLLIRGLRTLFVRYEKCSHSAQKIARHFSGHAKIERVLYPGLEQHPGHQIAKKQMKNGFGGMLSLLVHGGDKEAINIAKKVMLFKPATSLGGFESLIEHRKTVEGPMSLVPGNLLRLSIGLEATADLIADLEQAMRSL